MKKYLILYDGKMNSDFILDENTAKAKFEMEIKENEDFPLFYTIDLIEIKELDKKEFNE